MPAKCNECGYEGPQGRFRPHLYAAHDLECPNCGSTDINTSDLLKRIPGYSYGKNNTRSMKKQSKGE